MRGAFGVMAAAVATVVVAAWRRVQREGLEAPRGRPLPAQRSGAETRATTRPAATPISVVRRGAEPADPIRIVRRGAGSPEPSPATWHAAEPREPAADPEAAGAEPARADSFQTRRAEPVRAEPPGPLDEGPAREVEQAEPPAPFPAEAPERGREEPAVPPVAWDGGSAPLPARVPRPTFWPAILALGVTVAAWGAISTPLVIFGGLAVVAVALAFWIREMTHAD